MVHKDTKRNKALLKAKKIKCEICGETEYCCLELHHLMDKQYNISQSVRNLSTKLFKAELNKCICVCANCHKKLHSNVIKYGDNKEGTDEESDK